MLEYIFVLTAFIGSSIAAFYDVKTTEIPDKIPLIMVVVAFSLRGLYSLVSGDIWFLLSGLMVGGLFFLFGFFMYFTGQWGGGDAKLLAAIGALLPSVPAGFSPYLEFPFFLTFLINLFMVGSIFIIIYAFSYSFLDKNITKEFIKDMKGNKKESINFILVVFAILFGFFVLTSFHGWNIINPLLYFSILPGAGGLFVLFKFLKVVENKGFKKRIRTKDLEEGDMIAEDIKKLNIKSKVIRGLTQEEVDKIRKIKKTVWIKEGVRFGPVFPITLFVTLFLGDFLFLLMELLF